jgi:hypothetical protein
MFKVAKVTTKPKLRMLGASALLPHTPYLYIELQDEED